MLVSHHVVQLETTIYHKLCYKSPPPPHTQSYIDIIIKCHLSSNFLRKVFERDCKKKEGQLDFWRDVKQQQWKTERERDGGGAFLLFAKCLTLCPAM